SEHAALSGFENDGARAFDIGRLSGMNAADYDALNPMRWGSDRFFGVGGFFTPDRKARFVATPFRAPEARTDRRRRFLLNTGRVRDQWHTMTRTGYVSRLMTHQEE